MTPSIIKAGLAQISPVWLNLTATLDKVAATIAEAGQQDCDLIAFGEALAPGYPFWVELTGGARFNNDDQKRMFAHYVRHSIDVDAGDARQRLSAS
jgi:nitrilase